MKISTRTVLQADEGMVLTDGKTYGTTILLGVGRDADEFHEITKAEYEQIQADEERK